jgi:hypothetical protein
VSPGFTQIPQLGLQHTSPVLHVFIPHVGLTGKYIPSHGFFEQVPPAGTQIPQLALQQTSETLHVLGPQGALTGKLGDPHDNEQVSPGETQMLHAQLQHS